MVCRVGLGPGVKVGLSSMLVPHWSLVLPKAINGLGSRKSWPQLASVHSGGGMCRAGAGMHL